MKPKNLYLAVLALILNCGTAQAFDEKSIENSDDYARYRKVFSQVARDLISVGRCSKKDFLENGGWVRSMNFAPKPIYFVYCGGVRRENRIYLDAGTGDTFR